MASELTIGTLLESESAAPARLLAPKLNRHTFWCGQSGSGKTYALGVALEQIMLHTRLPLVVLDPNSDFVRLGDLHESAPPAEAEELATRDIRIRRSTEGAGEPLRARFLSMPLRSRAAILQIDPLFDADDYNTMLRMEGDVGSSPTTTWWGSCARTPIGSGISSRCVLRTSESGIGSCGRGGSAASRTTWTNGRMPR